MITSSQARIDAYETAGLWEGVTLHGLLQEQLRENAKRVAVVDPLNRQQLVGSEALRLTFAELENASNALAVQWLAQNIVCGDRIIVQLPNIAELVVCYFAASKLGAIISPLPMQYGQHELRHVSETLAASAYISVAEFRGKPFCEAQTDALPETTLAMAFGEQLKLQTQDNEVDVESLQRLVAESPINANRTLSICWTSGTTGVPKGVPRSHNMWMTVARNCIEAGDYEAGDRLLNPFPLVNMASVGSFLYPFVLLGCSLVLHHPFDPPVFLQQIQQEKINFTIVPPAMLNQLAKNQTLWSQFDFSALRSIGSGSAPLAPWMIDTFDNQYGKKIVNFYGSNEGINLFSKPEVAADPETRATMFPRFGADGVEWDAKAARTIETKVVCPQSGVEITEPGVVGELVVKGPTLFDGYYATNNEDVFTADGFFLTGDLVEICGEGNRYYRIAGRSKDIINRGGMKLSPTEIDVLLEGLPGSKEAAVCAYPDTLLGEKICACIVPVSEDEVPSLNDVVAFLTDKGLAKIKVPERLEVFDALPRNPLGKVQRFVLQERVSQIETA